MLTSRTGRFAAASLAAALAISLAACTPDAEPAPAPAETAPLLRLGAMLEPTSWDPAQANEGHLLPYYQAVYDTLLRRQPDGSLTPMLATEWELADDGLTLSLTLRDDVVFSDGSELDAEVVKANLDHFAATGGPMGSGLAAVDEVVVTGDDSIDLVLGEPDPALALALSGPAGMIASPETVGTEEIVTAPSGSGPYVLDTAATVSGSRYAFDRNADYWGDDLPFDRIEISVLSDETARVNALKSDQVDAVFLQTSASASDVAASGYANVPYDTDWEGLIFFDRTGAMVPELADVRVREALARAVDRDAILQAVQGGAGTLTGQIYGPESAGYDPEFDDAHSYDPERARELLAEAGAEDLEITLPVSPALDPAIYAAIIQNWQDVGVTVNRFEWGPGQALPAMLRGEWPLVYMAVARQIDWGQVPYALAPDATWNPLGTEDDELTALIDALQTSVSEEDIAENSRAINEFLVENYWFSPFYRLQKHYYFNDLVVAVEAQAANAVPYIYNYRPAE